MRFVSKWGRKIVNWGNEQHTRKVPASRNQARYVKAELSGTASYMIAVGHEVSGPLDKRRLRKACLSLLQRHDALRTHFEVSHGNINAIIEEQPRLFLETVKLRDRSFENFQDWATPRVFRNVDPFKRGSLVRFFVADYGDAWRFTIAGHHAITDGVSRGVMNRELLKLYGGETLSSVGSYYDSHSLEPAPQTNDLEAWVQSLPESAVLFSESSQSENEALPGVFEKMHFPELSKTVRRLAKVCKATRFNILSAVYALSLKSASSSSTMSSFFQSEGRKAVGASNSVVGPYSNTLLLDLSFHSDQSFSGLAQQLGSRTKEALSKECEPVMEAIHAALKAPSISLNMFPPAPRIAVEGLSVGVREFLDRRTEYHLNLVWSEDAGDLTARAFYDPSVMSSERVKHILRAQQVILSMALEDPSRTCEDLIKTAREPIEIKSIDGQRYDEVGASLHTKFEKNALAQPRATAIATSQDVISYEQLAARMRMYSEALHADGFREGQTVALIAHRVSDLVAAMLGVSKAGGQFAVIDAKLPQSRVDQLIEQLKPSHLISLARSDLAKGLEAPISISKRVSYPHRSDSQIAYHLFTSGSTGRPKKVSHPATTLQRFVSWQTDTLSLKAPITLMLAGLSHDPIMRDIFLPLHHGGTVVIPFDCEMANPERLRDLVSNHRVNILHMTPSLGRLLTIGAPNWRCPSIVGLFWGGERLTRRVSESWRPRALNARQFNLYGATETPQASLIHEIGQTETNDRIPIGRPMPWTNVQILGASEDETGVWEVGQIVVDLADPVLGVNDAGHTRSTSASRVHYTGDLGFITPDRRVQFIGRLDEQINLNGNRIELGEIEAAACAIDGVEAVCAVVSKNPTPELRLFVSGDTRVLEVDGIRSVLAQTLPSEAQPHRIEIMHRLPVTSNGKIDRMTLQGLSEVSETPNLTNASEPLNAEERFLAGLLGKYTDQSSPSRNESLRDLGVDSLSVIEVRLALEEAGYELPDAWDILPIRTLPQYRASASSQIGLSAGFSLHKMDVLAVLRCLAIGSIVLHHAGVTFLTGASIALFALTGYSIGRLQAPAIFNDGKTGRLWAMIARLLVPLIAVSIGLFTIHTIRGNDPHPAILFFGVNFVPFIELGMQQSEISQRDEGWLWFLHAYLQMFVIMAIIISIPRVFAWIKTHEWQAAIAFAVGSQLLMAATVLGAHLYFSDPPTLILHLERLPTTLFCFVSLGVLCGLASTPKQRSVALGLILLKLTTFSFVYGIHQEPAWAIALLVCLYLSTLRLPKLFSILVASISTQALMIYLTHWSVLLGLKLTFEPNLPILLETAIALSCGIFLGRFLRPIWRALQINWLAEQRVFFVCPSAIQRPLNARKGEAHE